MMLLLTAPAQFSFHSEQGSDHEGHLINNSKGKTEVTILDSLIENNNIIPANNIVIKIDVVKQEKSVFTGAQYITQKAEISLG